MTTGMTPHKWLQVRRIEQAKTLLLEFVDCDCGDRGRLWICRSEPFDAGLHPAGGHAAVGLAQRA